MEEGVDAGGLTLEWFNVLSKEMLNPNYALFVPSAEGMTYQPNRLSGINAEHLNYFKFIGRVIGMAVWLRECVWAYVGAIPLSLLVTPPPARAYLKQVYNDLHLDCHFTRSLYKHMLGNTPIFHDIESISPDYYKQLQWVLSNDIDAMGEDLALTFRQPPRHIFSLVPVFFNPFSTLTPPLSIFDRTAWKSTSWARTRLLT